MASLVDGVGELDADLAGAGGGGARLAVGDDGAAVREPHPPVQFCYNVHVQCSTMFVNVNLNASCYLDLPGVGEGHAHHLLHLRRSLGGLLLGQAGADQLGLDVSRMRKPKGPESVLIIK